MISVWLRQKGDVPIKVYLDVCCLNRPFDDQSQERIRLESEAVLAILGRCQAGEWLLVGSEAVSFEISRIPDDGRRQKVEALAGLSNEFIVVGPDTARRASDLCKAGLKPLDALHLACAEKAGVRAFLTTDDGLLKKVAGIGSMVNVKVSNPVDWLMEVSRWRTFKA